MHDRAQDRQGLSASPTGETGQATSEGAPKITGPAWIEDMVWWHVYPLGFVGAERAARSQPDVVHRLGHIEAWLDYAVKLGTSGLALGPIFSSATHGYDTIDHFQIDRRLGDDADFDSLLRAAHDRGLKVLLDGVFNHVGRGFPAFRQVVAEGRRAPCASWFQLYWPQDDSEQPPDFEHFEGNRNLPSFNHDEPAVADYVADVMMHWLDRGADGWRLDAAYSVPPRFWAAVLPRVRARFPDAYVVGEVIHGDYAEIVREGGLDAVTQYELWKAVWSGLNDRNFFELDWTLKRHNEFLETFVPLTFVGNHDVTRLATRLNDRRHLPHALAILFFCGGTPSVYAGDEQGFHGEKQDRRGGDDAVRPAFPPTPRDLPRGGGWRIYRLHQQLIRARRQHSWLHAARTTTLHLTEQELVYEARSGEQYLLVALNLGDGPISLPAPRAASVLAGAANLTGAGTDGARADLRGHGWAVLAP